MDIYIIIPHYKEGEETISPLFDSINDQEDIDFNKLHLVIGQSSLEAVFPDMSKWDNLKPRTTYIFRHYEKEAAGASREGALNWVKGESTSPDDYLFFFDCDDSLVNSHALADVISDIQNNDYPDYLQYAIAYKVIENKDIYYGKGKTDDIYAIWNCVYKIDYLKRYDIHSPTNLISMEDILFRICCRSIPGCRMVKLDKPFYVYNNAAPPHGAGLHLNYAQSFAELLTLVDDYNAWQPKNTIKNNVWFYKWVMHYTYVHLSPDKFNLGAYETTVPDVGYMTRVTTMLNTFKQNADAELDRLKKEEDEWVYAKALLDKLDGMGRLN